MYKKNVRKHNLRWPSFTSTSKDQARSELFVGNILMTITLKLRYPDDGRATDIEDISYFPLEQEVLLRPGVEFSIKKYVYNERNEKYHIYIEAYV